MQKSALRPTRTS